jgi:hypothetical protein
MDTRELNITKRRWQDFFGIKIMRDNEVYIRRWHIIPRNRWFNIYLHKTMLSDREVFHDHPWNNLSIILWGGYIEVMPTYVEYVKGKDGDYKAQTVGVKQRYRLAGDFIYRKAEQPHFLVQPLKDKPCWSLFITGKLRRTWGFYTKRGWLPHTTVVEVVDGQSRIKADVKEWI